MCEIIDSIVVWSSKIIKETEFSETIQREGETEKERERKRVAPPTGVVAVEAPPL